MKKTLVMKFGGAAVATPEHFSRIADVIENQRTKFKNIIVVVSAMGKTTDQLIELASQVNPNPPRREYDMLVSVGERISISLLAMALAKKNREAMSFTGSQSGIITSDVHSEAKILDVKPHRLIPWLDLGKIVIVAGFQGVSRKGEITTLGRGGSDTTAVALAIAFQAELQFYKDVPGVFSADPKIFSDAYKFPTMSYEEALGIVSNGAKILHPRCVELAWRNELPMHVLSFNNLDPSLNSGTIISGKKIASTVAPCYELEETLNG